MAYSKELESVIEAALADGVLTDKERAVLHKKALLEGVDPDELDVVIEGRLAKMKREEDWLRPTPPPTTEKRGNIVKCPNCGAPIKAGTVKCEECGYVFTNVSAINSVSSLFEKIQQISNSIDDKESRDERINLLINNFPVPTAKEDILEFLYMGVPNSKKRGNFFTLHPAIAGGIIGVVILLLASLIFAKDEVELEGGILEAWAGALFALCFVIWWLPLVTGGLLWLLLHEKSEVLVGINARANAWKSKSAQVIAKARIAMAGDPDLAKIESMAKQIGL